MKIIDGKKVSNEILEDLTTEIKEKNLNPGLAIIMVGDNPASEVYVRNKLKACEKVGIKHQVFNFDSTNTNEDVINCIKKLNEDKNIDGIIVQSPLPSNFNEDYIDSFILPNKDVDGFGITNLGYLASNETKYLSATPAGIIELLKHENINIKGAHVVIVGRSKIVGRPLALAMLNNDATVTITHSKTKNLKEITKQADILIVAIGVPKFIKEDFIKENAVVIDVGINRNQEGKLVGDVDYDNVINKVKAITPVPGGVGPMTIAMLLKNVVKSAQERK